MFMYVIFDIVECDYNGKTYNAGDAFNSTDGCNTWLVHISGEISNRLKYICIQI